MEWGGLVTKVDVKLINGIALAFEGDAVYSLYIRRYLIFQGQTKPNQLHRLATRYVSAKAQAMLIEAMLDGQLLTQEEDAIYKRGRNAHSHTKAKNTDILTYKKSTGFEAVLGYLHMTQQIDRLEELINWCITYVENRKWKRFGSRQIFWYQQKPWFSLTIKHTKRRPDLLFFFPKVSHWHSGRSGSTRPWGRSSSWRASGQLGSPLVVHPDNHYQSGLGHRRSDCRPGFLFWQ